ncbi:MAG: plasmid recombination protein [Desulfovibrio sp.]|nr:plasmid recombination protein [Desulfovibrio sp.]
MAGVCHVDKYHRGDTAGVQKHNEERESRTNPDIDPAREHLNEYVKCGKPWNAAVDERVAEIDAERERLGLRRMRHDRNAVLVAGVILGADHEFFAKLTLEEQRRFLHECVAEFGSMVGEENVLSVDHHYDEETPHVHVAWAPVIYEEAYSPILKKMVPAEALSGSRQITRGILYMIQQEMYARVFSKWGLPDREKGSKKRHVETNEYKEGVKKLRELQRRLADMRSDVETTEAELADMKKKVGEAKAAVRKAEREKDDAEKSAAKAKAERDAAVIERDEAKAVAESVLSDAEKAISKANDEADEIKRKAKQAAENEAFEIRKGAERDAEGIRGKARVDAAGIVDTARTEAKGIVDAAKDEGKKVGSEMAKGIVDAANADRAAAANELEGARTTKAEARRLLAETEDFVEKARSATDAEIVAWAAAKKLCTEQAALDEAVGKIEAQRNRAAAAWDAKSRRAVSLDRAKKARQIAAELRKSAEDVHAAVAKARKASDAVVAAEKKTREKIQQIDAAMNADSASTTAPR